MGSRKKPSTLEDNPELNSQVTDTKQPFQEAVNEEIVGYSFN